MAVSPYEKQPRRAFWKTAVAERAPLDTGDLYAPKFKINKKTRILTAGSCFAQHVGRALRAAEFYVVDSEAAPWMITDETANRFGYRLFSARYGNIYTSRQLLQLFREVYDDFRPAMPVWEKGGRYFDALRPSVEPDGMETPELVVEHRRRHLERVKLALSETDLLVFTFGLTEAWVHTDSGTIYPTAPGTIAGSYDPDIFEFTNLNVAEVLSDFLEVRKRMKAINRKCRFLVSVSPVPLTATGSEQHVQVATAYSKAILRTVCGMLYDEFDDVDYFPSYELFTSTGSRGVYFDANQRTVTQAGIDAAMDMFMAAHGITATDKPMSDADEELLRELDAVCEEELLEVFAR